MNQFYVLYSMKLRLIYVIFLFLSACATENDISSLDVFDFYCEEMDRRYVFFEEKGVNWDSLRTVYRPKINYYTGEDELFNILCDMSMNLNDAHLSIQRDTIFCNKNLCDTKNILTYNSFLQYYMSDTLVVHANSYSLFQFKNNILYIRLHTFGQPIVLSDIISDFSLFNYQNGIIIDIKLNPGGKMKYLGTVTSAFFCEEQILGYSRFKTGAGHSDFSDYLPEIIKGQCTIKQEIPVILIGDCATYSAGNLFAAYMKQRPNTYLIGNKTGGGGASREDYVLPNNWKFSISEIKFYDIEHKPLENGVEPDFYVEISETEVTEAFKGKPIPYRQIDFALNLINEINKQNRQKGNL